MIFIGRTPGKLFLEFDNGHAWSVFNDSFFSLTNDFLWNSLMRSWNSTFMVIKEGHLSCHSCVCVCCQALIFYFPSQSIFGSYRGFLKFWHRPAMLLPIKGFSDISWVVASSKSCTLLVVVQTRAVSQFVW